MMLSGRRARKAQPVLALDRSLRSIDADGHMRVEESRISKANVCPYLGREIPDFQRLGLDPNRMYRLLRDPEELKKAASTFDGKPLLIRHVAIDADSPRKDLWVGTLGKTTWEDPYLVTRPLMVLTQEAIDLIESEAQRELSAAYRYEAVMTPGVWGGLQYDGRMVNIRGNHTAIVSEGRVGPDVHVADELPPELKSMKHAATIARIQKLGLLVAGANLLALDAALGETPAESVISLDDNEMKAAADAALAEKKAEHGEDAELTEEEREQAFERARDKKGKDAKRAKDKAAKDKAAKDKAAKDKAAKDAAAKNTEQGEDGEVDHRKDFEPGAKDSVTKDEMSAAVKAATEAERARAREAAEARELVRPIMGVVSVAMDSAPEVYRLALKHSQVKTEGVHDSALKPLVELVLQNRARPAATPAVAMDAKGVELCDVDAIFSPSKAA